MINYIKNLFNTDFFLKKTIIISQKYLIRHNKSYLEYMLFEIINKLTVFQAYFMVLYHKYSI